MAIFRDSVMRGAGLVHSLQRLLQSERYLRLVTAARSNDYPARHAIVEEGIAETEGAERAHWLLLRASLMVTLPVQPMAKIEADVAEAIALVPGERDIICSVALLMLGIAAITEQTAHLGRWRYLIPRAARMTGEPWQFMYTFAVLAWRRGRPKAALRYMDRALEDMRNWTPERVHAFQGRYFLAYCYRALFDLELGLVEEAEADVAEAVRLWETVSKVSVPDRLLLMAQARLAVLHGDLVGARQKLQMIQLKDQVKNTPEAVANRAEVDLIAAQIALAGGNHQAVDHFCQRGQALAEQHNLPITAKRIKAFRERHRPGLPPSTLQPGGVW